jgi:mannose-1-phosphate guanylyltransferase/mannose-1-phosphate guanylyltransferase/mannose-6-phosphate isomerase
LLVLPSDHAIVDQAAFLAAIDVGRTAAGEGWLVTFGIAPEAPETGYGYIRHAEAISDGAFKVAQFAEKPDLQTARAWLAEGRWNWNAGIFLMAAAPFLEALEAHAPAIFAAASAAVQAQQSDGTKIMPGLEALAASPSLSVDHAVMEHSSRVAVVPVDMGWSDVGSWAAVHALGSKDEAGNVLIGDSISLGSRNCLIRSDGPVVVAIGVEDLVIVVTDGAVLIVPKSQSQRVKEAVEALDSREGTSPT